jgi:hypothetical protein
MLRGKITQDLSRRSPAAAHLRQHKETNLLVCPPLNSIIHFGTSQRGTQRKVPKVIYGTCHQQAVEEWLSRSQIFIACGDKKGIQLRRSEIW